MHLVLSPYEIDSASPAAVLAMMLAHEGFGVLTLQPGPFRAATPASARDLALAAPSFGRLLEAWKWTAPLWQCGLLQTAGTGSTLAEWLTRSQAELRADPMLTPAHAIVHPVPVDDEATFVEAVSRDVVRGGSDPSISLPMVGVTERLVIESESALVCGDAAGMIWKPRVGTSPCFSISLPLPLGVAGRSLLEWREALDAPLNVLRRTLVEAIDLARIGKLNGHATAVRLAAEEYARAFGSLHRSNNGPEGGRPAEITVSLSMLPAGHAVRQAVARLSRIAPALAGRTPSHTGALSTANQSIPVLRARASAWDFGKK